MVERKPGTRGGRGFLRAVSQESRDVTGVGVQEVIAMALGFRIVFSDQSEIWTVRGILRDGSPTVDDIGELSFLAIPSDEEPATAVTGFIALPPTYALAMNDDQLLQQIRGFVVQLGYDQDDYYVSIGVGGRHRYFESQESSL